jgi:Tfp pilus assembly protein PilN
MINLLSPQEKIILEQEEKSRLISVLLVIFCLSLLSFVLVMLSVKFYISGELESQKIIVNQRQLERNRFQSITQEINYQNIYLAQIRSFYQNNFSRSVILDEISQTLPKGTYLTSLSISSVLEAKSDKEANLKKYLSVSLVGFSPTRDTVLEIKDNLEKEEKFQEVYFPPSNWVKPNDVEFSVNFKVELK